MQLTNRELGIIAGALDSYLHRDSDGSPEERQEMISLADKIVKNQEADQDE